MTIGPKLFIEAIKVTKLAKLKNLIDKELLANLNLFREIEKVPNDLIEFSTVIFPLEGDVPTIEERDQICKEYKDNGWDTVTHIDSNEAGQPQFGYHLVFNFESSA